MRSIVFILGLAFSLAAAAVDLESLVGEDWYGLYFNGQKAGFAKESVTLAKDGTLTLLGRGSVCINTGGEKVYPEEVEESLKGHASVEDALVVGLPDDKWGQRIVGVVQLSAGMTLDDLALREQVRKTLAGYKVPKEIYAIDNLGRGPNGKADYKAITRYAEEQSAGVA